ncbi:MAG: endo-1,4-beta-xylanase [Huintestinicola sp.]|uniref:endo-1,4-beta-xylanase n=1 Tax=Huintestinicola sp. TaxID=2981661 RepID=UPI003F094322
MDIKKIGAAAAACILFFSACGSSESTGENTADTADESSAAQISEVLLSAETPKNDIPEISEKFSGFEPACTKRGSALLKLVDDEAASDGKALKIYNRQEAWNGADFNAELFRGNDIEVSGSFKSANPSVRVSVQFTVCGNTSYNMIFSVNTSDDAYTSGNGTFSVPSNAENILIYIESDNLEDIYADDLSVKVKGEYKYYAEAEGIAFADTSDYPSLKEAYGDIFRIGVAISPTVVEKTEYSELVKAQFNSITLENNMKPEAIFDHNRTVADKEKYMECPALRFTSMKNELDFARDNGMTVRGHTLVWHSQTPDWIFYKDYTVGGELADRELMLKRMENYIRSVMEWTEENYPGLVSAWDVVNEAIDDGGGIRKSLWYQTIGEDYISKAFEFARKYAPENVKLFYNDYNCYMPKKQKDILEFLKPVAEAGNIDGIGMQSHINTDISQALYMAALKKYSNELGVEIHVTELDIGTNKAGDYEKVQGDYYRSFMERLIGLKNEGIPITSVTLWGLSDSLSWKASDKPLIFNDDLSRKPAFDGMVEAVNSQE